MISQDAWNLELGFHAQKPIQLEPVQEHLSTDTGLLLFRQLDEQVGLTAAFAAQLHEVRNDPEHPILQMVRSRVYGILATKIRTITMPCAATPCLSCSSAACPTRRIWPASPRFHALKTPLRHAIY